MNILAVINPENVEEREVVDWRTRQAARAVVLDENDLVGLLHVTEKNYYKLPGGGVEAGENLQTALARECVEELGVQLAVGEELGVIVEYRSEFKLLQTSHCFLAKVASEKGVPQFTEEESANGFEIVWVRPEEARPLLSLGQTTDYEGHFIEKRDLCFLKEALKHS